MKLRTSKVLKMIAILLFSLESLVPTVFSAPYATPEQATRSKVESAFISQSLFLSLYTEECDTEEREDVISHEQRSLTQLLAAQSIVTPLDGCRGISFALTQHPRWASAPALFKLHCIYQI